MSQIDYGWSFWYFILSAFSSLRKSSLPLLIFVLGYFNHSCEWGPFDHLSSVRLEAVAFCKTSSSFMKTATVSHGKDMQIFISAPVFGIKYNCQTFGWGAEQAGFSDYDLPAGDWTGWPWKVSSNPKRSVIAGPFIILCLTVELHCSCFQLCSFCLNT